MAYAPVMFISAKNGKERERGNASGISGISGKNQTNPGSRIKGCNP
jgi:hypothetical protein